MAMVCGLVGDMGGGELGVEEGIDKELAVNVILVLVSTVLFGRGTDEVDSGLDLEAADLDLEYHCSGNVSVPSDTPRKDPFDTTEGLNFHHPCDQDRPVEVDGHGRRLVRFVHDGQTCSPSQFAKRRVQ